MTLDHVFCCRSAATGLELRKGATASLTDCSIFDNGRQGIMVWQDAGLLEAHRCEVHSHRCESGVSVMEASKTAVLKECALYGNDFAGAAVEQKGSMRLVRCAIHDNLQGVLIQGTGTGKVENCKIFNNLADGVAIGYDHTGKATIVGNKIHDNHSKGILLGTGRNDRVTLHNNEEHGNRGMPCLKMPNSIKNAGTKEKLKPMGRDWAKATQKNGSSFAKAHQASGGHSVFDAFMAERLEATGDFMQANAAAILACGFCNKPPENCKFMKCSTCLVVSYCSAKCQKSHWKGGHKEVCVPPLPEEASFLDPRRSVGDPHRV